MISRYAGDVHLDTDAVLLGELVLAPFNRFHWLGIDWGPTGLVIMSVILVINILFILFFYKELKIATFDAGLAATLGLAPGVIHYGLMGIVSITAVGAFDAVGSILVAGDFCSHGVFPNIVIKRPIFHVWPVLLVAGPFFFQLLLLHVAFLDQLVVSC